MSLSVPFRAALSLSFIPLGIVLVAATAASPLPPGPDLDLVKRVCAGCHSLDVVTAARHTPAEWDADVAKMVDRGAPANDAEQAQIIVYLSKNLPAKSAQ